MSEQQEKMKALKQTIERLEKTYGKGVVMKMDDTRSVVVDVISTGSFGLDLALGVGGFPRGRIVEIYGPESSGKTTIALHTIAEAQKKGGICAFIDAEHAFDRSYAEKLGIDLIWFGVLLGANLQTSFMHPPFGFALFYLRGVADKSVKSSDIYWGALPWVGMQLILVAIIIFVPETVTYFIDKPTLAIESSSDILIDPLQGSSAPAQATPDSSADIEKMLKENK